MIHTIIYGCYYLISVFIALVLLREIKNTKSAQEAVLYSIILVPFALRILQLK